MSKGTDPRLGPQPRDAADWRVYLESPDATETDWLAFEAWLKAMPVNAAEYSRIEMIDAELAHDRGDLLVALDARHPARLAARRMAGFAGIFAAAAAVALAIFTVHFPATRPKLAPTVYTAAKGHRRTIVFGDGTRIDLNSGSSIVSSMTNRARRIVLISGEAALDIMHDPHRPFLMNVADRDIEDIGTQLDVRRTTDAVQVTVLKGAVDVRPAADDHAVQPMVVNAGYTLNHVIGGLTSVTEQPYAQDSVAWRTGRSIYRDRTLAFVAADLSRYFAKPIRVEGSGAAKLRFSGVLVLDSEEAVVRRLEGFLPIWSSESDGVIALRQK